MNQNEYIALLNEMDAGRAARATIHDRLKHILMIAKEIAREHPSDVSFLKAHQQAENVFCVYGYLDETWCLKTDLIYIVSRYEGGANHCSIPTSWLYAPDLRATLMAELDRLMKLAERRAAEWKADREAHERAEFERLRAKFSNP